MKPSRTTQTLYAMKHLGKTSGQLLCLSYAYDVDGEITPRSAAEVTGMAVSTLNLMLKGLAKPDQLGNVYLYETRTTQPLSGGGSTRHYKLTPHGKAVINGLKGGKQSTND